MRVLHMVPDIGISNGIMSVILNYARAMPEDIKFDVVYFAEKEQTKQAEIEALGGRVFKINPPSPKTTLKGEMDKFFKAHKDEWKVLHINAPHFTVFIAPAAKRAGIKKICCHCHSTWFSLYDSKKARNKAFYELGKNMVDTKFACGRDAGRFWFGDDKNFTILPNAVDCQNFRYNQTTRKQKRKELGIEDKFVIGHLGRVSPPQKNHPYLFKIFSEIRKQKDNAVLLLAGAEPNDELVDLAKSLKIENDVYFLGLRKDAAELCQAYDVFVFPSFWEGLPVSVVEAQAAGLPVIMSDTITNEVCVTDNIQVMSIDAEPKLWADKAIELSKNDRQDTFQIMKQAGWDIFACGEKLADYYRG